MRKLIKKCYGWFVSIIGSGRLYDTLVGPHASTNPEPKLAYKPN